MGKAKFEWRITQYTHANLYTLIDWSGVMEFGELPPEYTNYHGQKFWVDGGKVVLPNLTRGTLPERGALGRGTVLEEAEFKAVELHLRGAAKRLQSINQAIKERSECVIMEV
jgi:hypothetical protein